MGRKRGAGTGDLDEERKEEKRNMTLTEAIRRGEGLHLDCVLLCQLRTKVILCKL